MARSDRDLLGDEPFEMEAEQLRLGVTVTWLSIALRMDRKTVKKRLAPCPIQRRDNRGPIYDLAMAMSYLVKPNFNIADYLRTMSTTELPPVLRKEFWDAENKRLNYMQRAGELWHTKDVLSVFSDAFMLIKTRIQIWPDEVERRTKTTPQQHAELQKQCDALRDELYKTLVEHAAVNHTASALETSDDDSSN